MGTMKTKALSIKVPIFKKTLKKYGKLRKKEGNGTKAGVPDDVSNEAALQRSWKLALSSVVWCARRELNPWPTD